MANVELLKNDIYFSVLSRLPTKDLLRLKCVCKQWCQLISSRVFWRARRKQPISGFFLLQKYELRSVDSGNKLYSDDSIDKVNSDDNGDELVSDDNGDKLYSDENGDELDKDELVSDDNGDELVSDDNGDKLYSDENGDELDKLDSDDNGDKLDQDDNANKLKSIITVDYISLELQGAGLHQSMFDFLPAPVEILASSNGLICCRSSFSSQDPALYVCNPLNKEWMRLSWTKPDVEASIGLSFDPCQDIADNSTQFKLVSIQKFVAATEDSYFLFNIYSSDTGLWTESRKSCNQRAKVFWFDVIFVGGILNWLTDFGEIVAFSVEKDMAWECSIPDLDADAESDFVYWPCIGESDGRLHYVMATDYGLHIWSLEDYVEPKWNLKYSRSTKVILEEHPILACRASFKWPMLPLAFQDGYLLMNDDKDSGDFYLYNIETHKINVGFLESEEPNWSSSIWTMVLPYTMSLVPLNSA